MTDTEIINAMIEAYWAEISRTRANHCPKPWTDYAAWVRHESFSAVLKTVRELDKN